MYEGESESGVKNGWGRYIWSNGDYFEGIWKNGVPDGYGVQVSENGNTKKGLWKNNKYCGEVGN